MSVFQKLVIAGAAMGLVSACCGMAAMGQAGKSAANPTAAPAVTSRTRNQEAAASASAKYPQAKLRTIYAEITRADADAKSESAHAGQNANASTAAAAKSAAGQQYTAFLKIDKDKRTAIGAKYKLSEAEIKAVWLMGKQSDWPSGAGASKK